MVYIDRNGTVLERRPWDLARIFGVFTGTWFIMVQFLRTLIAPFQSDNSRGDRTDSRRSGWGGGGGGGGGGPNRPNRRIGRINNTSINCNIPGGGCCAR